MSIAAVEWVLTHSDVKHRGDLLVLIVLASHAQDDGDGAFPSVATIAAKARLTRRGAQLALGRLKKAGAIEQTGTSEFSTTVCRVVMTAVAGGELTLPPGERTHFAGANSEARSARLTSPEPSSEPSGEGRAVPRSSREETVLTSGRAKPLRPREPASPPDGDVALAERICGVLQRGIDGLTSDEPSKRPTLDAILATLRAHRLSPQDAEGIAVEVRSIVQSQAASPPSSPGAPTSTAPTTSRR